MKAESKILIIVLLALALDIAFIVLFVFPSFLAIVKNSKDYLSFKKELATIQAELSNFKDFKTHQQIYLQKLKEMDNLVKNQLFIQKELPTELITFCQKEAQRENLGLEITPYPSKEKEKNLFDYIFLKIKLKGNFPAFLRFLKRIENSKWLVEVQKVTLVQKKEGLEIDLIVKAYAQNRD